MDRSRGSTAQANRMGRTPNKMKRRSFPATSSNNIPLGTNMSNLTSRPKVAHTSPSNWIPPEHDQDYGGYDAARQMDIRDANRGKDLTPLLTSNPYNSYDSRGDGIGKVFKMGGGESYRPGGDPPRSPIGRADTFRSSDRDRRSPRRERARTPIRDRDRDRARTPLRDRERARTPLRDRARTPIRDRARTPPPTDRYMPPSRDRSPRRRSRSPISYRRRERTPLRDSREGSTWRAGDRARSPPPRRLSPRRDSPRRGSPRRSSPRRSPPRRASPRRDSPRRDDYRDDYRRDRAASPRRDLIRDRDTRARSRSPYDRDRTTRARSPLPARRSPPPTTSRSNWRRSRTPERRNERVFTGTTYNGPTSLTWRRPRSPSPAPRDSQQTSHVDSGSNSRRSSPPIHPSRLALQPSKASTPLNRDRSESARPTSYRDEDVEMQTPQDRSPVQASVSRESPVRRSPPRGPSSFRAPPSGPSSGPRNFTAPVPSVSAHNRPENNVPTAPPAGPRGYQPPFRGRGRGSFSVAHRGDHHSWHNTAATRLNNTSVSPTIPNATPTAPSGIPTGPRAGNHTIVTDRSKTWTPAAPRAPASATPFRAVSQRFDSSTAAAGTLPSKPHIRNHPSLSSLPTLVPGGRKDPNASGMPRELEARLKKNEEEAERLREDLRIKEEKIRAGLRQWERLERESEVARLRSELSEQQVKLLAGEGIGGAF